MVAYTYTELSTNILNYTEDDSDEFSTELPNIIKNAQDRVTRDLDLEIFKQTYTDTFTVNSHYVSKPSDILTISSFFYVDGSNNNIFLQPRGYDFCVMWGGLNVSGTLKYYNEGYSDSQIFVVKRPSQAFTYHIRGLKRPDYMTPSKASNWLGNHAGDLLLFAALVESERFLMSTQEGKPQEWETEYQKRLITARPELAQIARIEYSPLLGNRQEREE